MALLRRPDNTGYPTAKEQRGDQHLETSLIFGNVTKAAEGLGGSSGSAEVQTSDYRVLAPDVHPHFTVPSSTPACA